MKRSGEGTTTLIGLLMIQALGLGYACAWPKSFWKHIRHMPANQEWIHAGALAFLGVCLPWLQGHSAPPEQVALAAIVLFAGVFAWKSNRHRQALREDRIQGREVLVVAVGSRAARGAEWGLGILAAGLGFLLGWAKG